MAGIDDITIGRQFPRLAWEWDYFRADRVPAVTFSGLAGWFEGIDTGVSATGHTGRFNWYGGLMLGDRHFGNVPKKASAPDGYLRGEYALNEHYLVGASQRIASVPLWTAHTVLNSGDFRLSGEMTNSAGQSREAAQIEWKVVKSVTMVVRQQWLEQGDRTGFGGILDLGKDFELKAFRESNDVTFVQTTLRW
jgi:hypothetical protein